MKLTKQYKSKELELNTPFTLDLHKVWYINESVKDMQLGWLTYYIFTSNNNNSNNNDILPGHKAIYQY